MLDGRSRLAYFTPDSSVFNDTDFPRQFISYQDLYRIRGAATNPVELKAGETSVAVIAGPTFFSDNADFPVYPSEHIIIKKGKYNDYTIFKKHGSKRRNRELNLIRNFLPFGRFVNVDQLKGLTLDSIFLSANYIKFKIAEIQYYNISLFDSLLNAAHASKKFKKFTGHYLDNWAALSLYEFYNQNRDTLVFYGLYDSLLKDMLPYFNDAPGKANSNLGYSSRIYLFNQYTDKILPVPWRSLSSSEDIDADFDSTLIYFNGAARDYILTRLLYTAFTNNIPVSNNYVEKYNQVTANKDMQHLIKRLVNQQENIKRKAKAEGDDNCLVSFKIKKVTTIDKILQKNKGHIIVFDFWASWCDPCVQEIPYLKLMMKNSKNKNIRFISLSLDKERQPWQKYIITNGLNMKENYNFVNFHQSSFIDKYQIRGIPRFIIIDKSGKIVNEDAPRPSDPELQKILDKLSSQ